jgi:probable HAF family extracellular repeat protein
MQDLGTIGGSWGEGEAISDDGSIIGGSSYVAGTTTAHAFRWTSAAGIQDLGTLPDNPTGFSGVKSMTASGAILVGVDFPPNGNYRAFLWSEKTGMINLNAYLAQQGLDLTGWSKFAPAFISADGTHLVGHGLHNNVDVSFIINNFSLSSPVPATPVSSQIALALALAVAGAMLARRQTPGTADATARQA